MNKTVPAGRQGFTMIEVLAVVAILAILMTMSIFTFMTQLTKGRDARRKADLEKVKTVLEDYLNDEGCYPASLPFGHGLPPYLSQLPADPLNNINYNYFYSFDAGAACKNWYKIYAKLENTNDPIIAKVGCANGCGPSGNYNYWISSPNVTQVTQITGESWPVIPTLPPPVSTATPIPTVPAAPTSTPTPPPGGPTSTPAPTTIPAPTSTPTLVVPAEGDLYGCFSGVCTLLPGPICNPSYYGAPTCEGGACCFNQCGTPLEPRNECH